MRGDPGPSSSSHASTISPRLLCAPPPGQAVPAHSLESRDRFCGGGSGIDLLAVTGSGELVEAEVNSRWEKRARRISTGPMG